MLGYATNSKLSNCKSSGSVTGYYGTGGIAGFITNQSIIYASKNEAEITGDIKEGHNCNNIGGMVGVAIRNSEVKYCYNTGNVTVYSNCLGGIIGKVQHGGKFEYIYNNAPNVKIYGQRNDQGVVIGGIVGDVALTEDVYINNCYNLSNIEGIQTENCKVGGLIGWAWRENNVDARLYLKNAYNKGKIQNGDYVGGIAGEMYCTTIEGEILNYGSVSNAKTYLGAIFGKVHEQTNNTTKRAYGGNCSSTIKTNGGGTTNSYDANLVMPSVYQVVNEMETEEFVCLEGAEDTPKLKAVE